MNYLAVIVLSAVSAAAHAGGLDHYREGAICDRRAGFCADHMGVSVALTRLYLGARAESRLMEMINKVGVENFDPSIFTMSGGLTCHTQEKTCWTQRHRSQVDVRATRLLFHDRTPPGQATPRSAH
jgi:Fels-1 Prophage Protein-like